MKSIISKSNKKFFNINYNLNVIHSDYNYFAHAVYLGLYIQIHRINDIMYNLFNNVI